MTEEEIDERTEAAQAVFEEACLREPQPGDWGFFSYADGPPAAGGGAGGFSWFADRPSMLRAVVDHLVFFNGGPASADPEVVIRRVADIVEGMARSADGLEAARVAINEATKGFSQITWWGTFDALCAGDGAFERETRSSHRERLDAEPAAEAADRPIASSALEEFREHLEEYGM